MKKWIYSALLYLGIVIVGYFAYTNYNNEDKTEGHSDEHTSSEKDGGHEAGHGGDHSNKGSEVNVEFSYKDGSIDITLQDSKNNPVTEIEVNHEKLIHLIVVDEHLDQYYHLHPEQVGEGKFTVKKDLEEGSYKAFVDIKPKELAYDVESIAFDVGTPDETHAHEGGLKPDTDFNQTFDQENSDGKTLFEFNQTFDQEKAVMKMNTMEAGKPVTLSFEVDESKLEPYLGAMGHVVILDEAANEYVHVHPATHDKPVFETQFEKPGIYKIWAEFKQDGKVRPFPFVVEIK